MEYSFLKDTYKSLIYNVSVDNSTLKELIENNDNHFILKHNVNTIFEIIKFLNSTDSIFILNGFMGSGKTAIADFIYDLIDENALVFRNSYQEAINLDDILLSMFKDFYIYHNDKKIILPKVETNIFSEKINAYIKYCDAPMVFIFDSLEINMRNKDTQKDILDFINYLSHFSKIKIIICSRSFKQDNLYIPDSAVSHSLKPITKDEMYDYLEENEIEGTRYECEELYKETRGHYLLLELSVLIMQILNISLTLFSSEYKKSTKNFLEFLVSKILSISSEKFIKPLILLSVLRHGVCFEFFERQKFATKEDIDFLLSKHVISEKFGRYYLKDYIRTEFIKTISVVTQVKIHKYLLEAYEDELALKPFDRIMFLSRLTMRQEIAYHSEQIKYLENSLSMSAKSSLNEIKGISYISYSKSMDLEAEFEPLDNNNELKDSIPGSKKYIKNIKPIIDKNKKSEDSQENKFFLNQNSSIYTDNNTNQADNRFNNITSVPQSIDEYMDIAQKYEEIYNFSGAILYYKKALSYTNDDQFPAKEPVIYTKLAICYKKIQNIDESIKFYEKVFQLYKNRGSDKALEVLLNIAQIYNENYKFDKAKDVYNRILSSDIKISNELFIRVNLNLAEIEDNEMSPENAVKYIQKALAIAEKSTNLKLLSECYFKYALILDDTNNIDIAIKYYLRCIQASNNPEINQYISSAYSNLAEISIDQKDITSAKMYYEHSIEADSKQNNNEGLYFSYSKLASLYKKEDSDKTYELLVQALSSAKKLDDISYTISAYIEIGDYYLNIGNYKQTLKSYMIAKSIVPPHTSEELTSKITAKINKVKIFIGEVEFMKILNEIKKKR